MLRRALFISRPLALALSIFIVLNVWIAIENSNSSATRVWLNLQFPEPALSVFAGVLGLVLFLPHELGRHAWIRWLLGGVIFGFCILVGANVIGYYHRLYMREFRTSLPVPFSSIILVTLLFEFARVSWWAPVESRLPAPAWFFLRSASVAVAFFVLIGAHIVTFGVTDYRRPADAAVIFGAKVYDDGTLSPALRARVDTGVELFHEGLVDYLIMTGGTGPNGESEPERMTFHAVRRGVPLERILRDPDGTNTRASARNCRTLAEDWGFERLLTVSQDFHCARIKLIFEREGVPCYSVPAGPVEPATSASATVTFDPGADGETPAPVTTPSRPVVRLSFPLIREIFAYPFYFLYYA